MNRFTKNKTLIYSFIISFLFFISYFINKSDFCDLVRGCPRFNELFIIYSLPFITVLVFSLITFKLKETTFYFWRNFSVWFIPISLIIITFLPTRTHGLDFVPMTKGAVMFFLTILYSAISIVLIIFKSLKKENEKSSQG